MGKGMKEKDFCFGFPYSGCWDGAGAIVFPGSSIRCKGDYLWDRESRG